VDLWVEAEVLRWSGGRGRYYFGIVPGSLLSLCALPKCGFRLIAAEISRGSSLEPLVAAGGSLESQQCCVRCAREWWSFASSAGGQSFAPRGHCAFCLSWEVGCNCARSRKGILLRVLGVERCHSRLLRCRNRGRRGPSLGVVCVLDLKHRRWMLAVVRCS